MMLPSTPASPGRPLVRAEQPRKHQHFRGNPHPHQRRRAGIGLPPERRRTRPGIPAQRLVRNRHRDRDGPVRRRHHQRRPGPSRLDRRFLLIAPSDQADAAGPNQGLEDAAVEKLLEQRVEGLLYAATYHRGVHVPESANEVPTVLINCFDADGKLPSIVPDERAGGRVAVERLLQAGHSRIGVINLDPDIPAAVGRLEGAREALADAGLELDPELVVSGCDRRRRLRGRGPNPGPLPKRTGQRHCSASMTAWRWALTTP